jgi:acyl-CoA reductase-like NAD-dependent aldehyde dehydrogenase
MFKFCYKKRGEDMAKPNVKKAKKHLAKLRELVSKRKHPFSDMTEEEVIKALRKTREEIWKEKVVARS